MHKFQIGNFFRDPGNGRIVEIIFLVPPEVKRSGETDPLPKYLVKTVYDDCIKTTYPLVLETYLTNYCKFIEPLENESKYHCETYYPDEQRECGKPAFPAEKYGLSYPPYLCPECALKPKSEEQW